MSRYANTEKSKSMTDVKRVRCVDAGGIKKGECYEVVCKQHGEPGMYILRGYENWSLHVGRFEAVPDEPAPAPPASDWFALYLAGDKQARKQAPLARGFAGYFPNAMIHVSHVSFVANEQHNPGKPIQWAYDKSSDEPDCELRHMLDSAGTPYDDDGLLHLAKKAWRAMADLERYVLKTYPNAKPGASVTGCVR